MGELFASNGAATNLKTETVNAPGMVTLNAMLQPAMSQVSYASVSGGGTYTGTAAPTAQVQFFEGATMVGTGTLGGNGTIATATLTGVPAGTHSYTAFYPGDGVYTVPYPFGSVTVTVTALGTTTTVSAMPASTTYGMATMVSANVTGTGMPGGMVQFFDGQAMLGAAVTLSSGSASESVVLGAGSHSITAVYQGDANDSGSTSATAAGVTVMPALLQVTAANASRVFGTVNQAFSYTVSGFVNGDTAATAVSGTAAEASAATRASVAGTYQISVSAGSLAAANYTFSYNNGTLTVTGGAAQTIVFPALYNFVHGTTATLLATASSGANVTFTVASGPASINGSTLKVTGTGPVTITANQAGTADYAAAPAVSESFVAQ